LSSGGTMTDLGTLNTGKSSQSEARAINSSGQVVGQSTYSNTTSTLHAVLWQGGTKTDLNKVLPRNSGWELLDARGINDTGTIVGQGTHIGYGGHAYMLVPGSSLQAAAALASGAAAGRSRPETSGPPLLAEPAHWATADVLRALVSLASEGGMGRKRS